MKCSKHLIKKLARRIHFHQFRVRIITHSVFDALVGNLKILKSQKTFNYQIKNHSLCFIVLGFFGSKVTINERYQLPCDVTSMQLCNFLDFLVEEPPQTKLPWTLDLDQDLGHYTLNFGQEISVLISNITMLSN